MESNEALDDRFRTSAGPESEQFRREVFEPGGWLADELRAGKTLDDAALLREITNTFGKPARLGASIRCLVSVSSHRGAGRQHPEPCARRARLQR